MVAEIIKGRLVQLRVAEECDAEFTLSVRQNEAKNKYIPRLDVSLDKQREWIAKERRASDSIFFVVERLNGEPIGTYSLYNISEKEAEAGRLVMLGNQLETIETGVLFSDYCFNVLEMNHVRSVIVKDNLPALGFSLNVGGVEEDTFVDEQTGKHMVVHVTSKDSYYKKRDALLKVIERFSARGNT